MKMMMGLYIGFFVVFTTVFSQIAFPMSTTVTHVSSIQQKDDSGRQLAEEVEYEVLVETTRIMPVHVLSGKLLVPDKYKDRLTPIGMSDVDGWQVPAFGTATFRMGMNANTAGMSQQEIDEMLKSVEVRIKWQAMPGWDRENRVYVRG